MKIIIKRQVSFQSLWKYVLKVCNRYEFYEIQTSTKKNEPATYFESTHGLYESTWIKISSHIIRGASPICQVLPDFSQGNLSRFLRTSENITLDSNNTLKGPNNEEISVIRKNKSLTNTPFFIFQVHRNLGGTKQLTEISAEEQINCRRLVGVVSHIGNHYISYILFPTGWFRYDDITNPHFQFIGTTHSDIVSLSEIAQHGVLYFYV